MTTDFHNEALAEYHNSAAYSENMFGLGEEFVQAVEHAIAAISSDPKRYKPAGENLHDFRMERFPYHLFTSISPARNASPFSPSPTPPAAPTTGSHVFRPFLKIQNLEFRI